MIWSDVTINEAVQQLRTFQRHWLLRQYGKDGQVLPENIRVSRALDFVLERLVAHEEVKAGAKEAKS